MFTRSSIPRQLSVYFGEELRLRRQGFHDIHGKNWTQKDLADAARISVDAVASLERGVRTPNLKTAFRVCWAMRVNVADVIRKVEKRLRVKQKERFDYFITDDVPSPGLRSKS